MKTSYCRLFSPFESYTTLMYYLIKKSVAFKKRESEMKWAAWEAENLDSPLVDVVNGLQSVEGGG